MRFLVIGAGTQARAVAYDLVRQNDVEEVRVADINTERLGKLKRVLHSPKGRTFKADASARLRMANTAWPTYNHDNAHSGWAGRQQR